MSLISWPGPDSILASNNMDSWITTPLFINTVSPNSLPMTVLEEDRHPSFPHLIILVLAAVLEVVCVSLPGYIIARQGMFDAESQKFLANLNVMLFTPCLSMCPSSNSTWARLTDRSIYKDCFSADSREIARTGHNTYHLCHTDPCFLFGRYHHFEAVQVQEAATVLCHSNGSLRKLKLIANIADYIFEQNYTKPEMEQDLRGQ
jgi:hypothetical protein